MTRNGFPLRATVAAVLMLAASGAGAQGGGSNLLPGASSQRKLEGGAITSCSATNALRTKQCSTTCPAGQSADCEDGDDGSDPTCACSGG